ncbi:hypothetical protein, partial [Nostoc sp. CCY 9925]|uniref:hypothetical protein n=1 Tax=Nostoc sp. CCY 9925 TaxID=3103865 RepID=UPI0039C6E296
SWLMFCYIAVNFHAHLLNSKFWLQDNAEIMLHLRCQWIAKSWDNFSDAIFNSFIKPQSA